MPDPHSKNLTATAGYFLMGLKNPNDGCLGCVVGSTLTESPIERAVEREREKGTPAMASGSDGTCHSRARDSISTFHHRVIANATAGSLGIWRLEGPN